MVEAPSNFTPHETVDGNREAGLLLVCDHARADIPESYGRLGLGEDQLSRHIAYDIGVEGVTRGLAEALGVPAILSTFSRLLIDPNRGSDDPTLVMRLSDGDLIPGNARIDSAEIAQRKALFHEPYHQKIEEELHAIEGARAGNAAFLFSVHSFTPIWRGAARPWEVAILWDCDPRMPTPILDLLRQDETLSVGDNEPYDGALKNDCMYRHGTSKGRAHALVEIRQDLISDAAGIATWVDKLAPILKTVMADPSLATHEFFTSRTN